VTLVPGANIGPYRVVEQIGRGGMATVYKAYQASLARYVAIKVLPAFFAEQPGFAERFQQEAIAVAKLRHPNIVQIFDYGQQDGVSYIAGEFIDGGTLAEQVGKPLPPDYTVKMLRPIAGALDYAHSRDVLHRDVKPSNILQARDGTPILSDFGLAKIIGSGAGLTASGATVGTPEYMAPEQGQGLELTPAADQYALGVVAYEMLTGRVPFSADTPLAVLIAHMQKPLPLPRTVNPNLSKAIEAVLLKALAKEPGDRFPNVTQFVNALEDPAAHTAIISTKRPAARAGVAPGRDRRPLIAGGAVAGLLLLAGIAFAVTRGVTPAATGAQAPAASGAGPATSTPVPTATPVTTGTTPTTQKKGNLVYTSKLDASEINQQHVFPDDSFGSVRAVPGAIELTILKNSGSAAMLLSYRPQNSYVAEYDVQMNGTNLTTTVNLRSGPTGGYEVALNGTQQTVVLRRLDCQAGQCNVVPIGAPMSVTFDADKTVTVGVTVQGANISLWVDGKAGPTISNAADGNPLFSFSAFGNTGTFRLVGLRVYDVPS